MQLIGNIKFTNGGYEFFICSYHYLRRLTNFEINMFLPHNAIEHKVNFVSIALYRFIFKLKHFIKRSYCNKCLRFERSRLKEGEFAPHLHTRSGDTESHNHYCSILPAPVLHEV